VSPDAAYPRMRLGMVYAIRGDFGSAQAPLRRAVALDPTQAADILRQLDSLASARAEELRFDAAVETAAFAIGFAEEHAEPAAAASLRARLPVLRGQVPASAKPLR
jgi:hypothetical protein